MVRPEFLEITGDPMAGVALAVVVGWTDAHLDSAELSEQKPSPWVRLTMKQLVDHAVGLAKRRALERGIDRLVDLGFVERRDGAGNDRAKLYRLNATAVNRAVADLAPTPNPFATGATPQVAPTPNVTRASDVGTSKNNNEESGDARVADIWAYWVERRQPRRRELEASQAKLIAKGLALAQPDELKRAIDALLADEWHRERGLLNLSTLLATKPGGPTLRDQIDRWLDRAPSAPAATPVGVTLRPRRRQEELEQLIRATRSKARRPPYPDDLQDFVGDLERERLQRRDELAAQLRERFGVIATFAAGDDDQNPGFRDA